LHTEEQIKKHERSINPPEINTCSKAIENEEKKFEKEREKSKQDLGPVF
jgi:hypothetical protein